MAVVRGEDANKAQSRTAIGLLPFRSMPGMAQALQALHGDDVWQK